MKHFALVICVLSLLVADILNELAAFIVITLIALLIVGQTGLELRNGRKEE